MSKQVTRTQLKSEGEEKLDLHPAAATWNAVVEKFEELKILWEKHKETYLLHKGTIGMASRETQIQLSGILHRQEFGYVLDYMVKYAKSGYLPLTIKKEA